ncbi:MAG: hypothetical protein A2Z20_11010 [Bdellovibrionales bacterium RBG_16_40_8]|nr:MAG: hypothetical protein A2Z20_11010 [Bdellovibrionales bacterium RBG_16_40_8]
MKQNKNNSRWLVIASLSMVGLIGSIDFASASVNSETRKAASRAGAATVAEISFSKESVDLSDGAKKELQEAISAAGKKGEIKEVRVAAWADQEYPPKGVALAGSQIDLAEKRAESVQSYLKQSLNVSDVSTINMAERPTGIQNMLKTPGAKTKNILENSGAAPTGSDQTGLFGLKGKASQAVIMIYYKK